MVLDGLLYRAPVGLVVLDARGAIASLNEQAHQIFQSDGAPINGTPLADLFPESQQKLLQRHLGGSRRQKKTASQPIVLERRTAGRKKQLLELRLAVIEGHDEAACWICSVENVTKREQTTSAHERTRRDLERRVTQRTKVLAALNKTLKQEIADHQRSDESLHESRQQLSLALGAAQVGTWVWEVGEDAVTWDDYIHPLFGLEPGTFPGRYADFLDLVHA